MVMLVIVLLHLIILRKWFAAFITCYADSVDCAAGFFKVTATLVFLAYLVLRSTTAANDVH